MCSGGTGTPQTFLGSTTAGVGTAKSAKAPANPRASEAATMAGIPPGSRPTLPVASIQIPRNTQYPVIKGKAKERPAQKSQDALVASKASESVFNATPVHVSRLASKVGRTGIRQGELRDAQRGAVAVKAGGRDGDAGKKVEGSGEFSLHFVLAQAAAEHAVQNVVHPVEPGVVAQELHKQGSGGQNDHAGNEEFARNEMVESGKGQTKGSVEHFASHIGGVSIFELFGDLFRLFAVERFVDEGKQVHALLLGGWLWSTSRWERLRRRGGNLLVRRARGAAIFFRQLRCGGVSLQSGVKRRLLLGVLGDYRPSALLLCMAHSATTRAKRGKRTRRKRRSSPRH